MSDNSKQGFKLKKVTDFNVLADSKEEISLPPSDLCFTTDKAIYQFEYIREEDEKLPQLKIKPGIYDLKKSMAGLMLLEVEFSLSKTLSSINNTKAIKSEMDLFFRKLDVYKRRNLPPKRAVLLHGPAGTGKTTSIKKAVLELIKEDPGTACIIWPTSEIEPEQVSQLFTHQLEYAEGVTRIILIAEDIGGQAVDTYGRSKASVTSGMLNFLDGTNVIFKIPTFIIATTNYPENLLEVLADRPGRFDQLLELPAPDLNERIELVEFLAERPLTQEESSALGIKGAEKLSIAHLRELIIRSELHDKTYEAVIKEMVEHTENVQRGFAEKKKQGFGLSHYDD